MQSICVKRLGRYCLPKHLLGTMSDSFEISAFGPDLIIMRESSIPNIKEIPRQGAHSKEGGSARLSQSQAP